MNTLSMLQYETKNVEFSMSMCPIYYSLGELQFQCVISVFAYKSGYFYDAECLKCRTLYVTRRQAFTRSFRSRCMSE